MKVFIKDAVRLCIRGKQVHYAMLAVVVIILPFVLFTPEPRLFTLQFIMPLAIGIALYASSDAIGREIQNKRIDLIITRPVRRYEILYGRLLGTVSVFTVCLALSVALLLIVLAVRGRLLFTGGEILGLFVTTVFLVALNVAIGVFVRRFPNWLVIVLVFFAYLIISGIKTIPGLPSVMEIILNIVLYIMPPFGKLNLMSHYGIHWSNLLFIGFYLCALLILATIWFNRREIARR